LSHPSEKNIGPRVDNLVSLPEFFHGDFGGPKKHSAWLLVSWQKQDDSKNPGESETDALVKLGQKIRVTTFCGTATSQGPHMFDKQQPFQLGSNKLASVAIHPDYVKVF